MEYVKVTFPTRRLVYIDDEQNGYTNEVLRVDAGTHVFELRHRANFRPPSHRRVVQHTTTLAPMEIPFYNTGGR